MQQADENFEIFKDLLTRLIYTGNDAQRVNRSIMSNLQGKVDGGVHIQTRDVQLSNVSLGMVQDIPDFATPAVTKRQVDVFGFPLTVDEITLDRDANNVLRHLTRNASGHYELRIPSGVRVEATLNGSRISFDATLVAAFAVADSAQEPGSVEIAVRTVVVCGVSALACDGDAERCNAIKTLVPYAVSAVANKPIRVDKKFSIPASATDRDSPGAGIVASLAPFFTTPTKVPEVNPYAIRCTADSSTATLSYKVCRALADERVSAVFQSVNALFPLLVENLWKNLNESIPVGYDAPEAEGIRRLSTQLDCDAKRQDCRVVDCKNEPRSVPRVQKEYCESILPGDVRVSRPDIADRYPAVFSPGQSATIGDIYHRGFFKPVTRRATCARPREGRPVVCTPDPNGAPYPCLNMNKEERHGCHNCGSFIVGDDKVFCDQFMRFWNTHCANPLVCTQYVYRHEGAGVRINEVRNALNAIVGVPVSSEAHLGQVFRGLTEQARVCCVDDNMRCVRQGEPCGFGTRSCFEYMCANPDVLMSVCVAPLMLVASGMITEFVDFSALRSDLALMDLNLPRGASAALSARNADHEVRRSVVSALGRFDRYRQVSCSSAPRTVVYDIPVDHASCHTSGHFVATGTSSPGVECVRQQLTISSRASSSSNITAVVNLTSLRLTLKFAPSCEAGGRECCQVSDVYLSATLSDVCVVMPDVSLIAYNTRMTRSSLCAPRQIAGQHALRQRIATQSPFALVNSVLSGDPTLLPMKTLFVTEYRVGIPVQPSMSPQYAHLDEESHVRFKVPFAYHVVTLGQSNPLVGKGVRIADPFEIQMSLICATNGNRDTCVKMTGFEMKLEPRSIRLHVEDEYTRLKSGLPFNLGTNIPELPPHLLTRAKTRLASALNSALAQSIQPLPAVCI